MDLSSIKNPDFLKALSFKELDELAVDIRECIIDTVSKKGQEDWISSGGHLCAQRHKVLSLTLKSQI